VGCFSAHFGLKNGAFRHVAGLPMTQYLRALMFWGWYDKT